MKFELKTENNRDRLRKMIIPFLERSKEKEGVLAVILLGGLSNNNNRGHTDEFSDIDVTIVYDGLYEHAPNYEFYLFDNGRKVEVNVHQMILQNEAQLDWDDGKKEAYSKAEYYYEKDNRTRELVNSKVTITPEYRFKKLALLLGQYKWYVEINPLRAIKRGLYENGIDLLNRAIDMYVETVYLYNYQYMPHCKWKIDIAAKLNYLPDNYEEDIKEALKTDSIDPEGIIKKREKVIKLYSELINKISQEYGMGIDDMYNYACKNSYSDRQLLQETYIDKLISRLSDVLNSNEALLLQSLVNFYTISSDEEFLDLDNDELEDIYQEVYLKVRGELKNEKGVKIKKANYL